MGCYVNPVEVRKEDWLNKNGEEVGNAITFDGRDGCLPVCLINNGFFTAAGVCYSESEFKAFKAEDGRKKRWFYVKLEKLHEVCEDLKD